MADIADGDLTLSIRMLGRGLRECRWRRRLRIVDLSVRSGVSYGTIARIEKGEGGVAIGVIVSLVRALGLSGGVTLRLEATCDGVVDVVLDDELPPEEEPPPKPRRVALRRNGDAGSEGSRHAAHGDDGAIAKAKEE